jgi:hypothetical protein
MLRGSPRSPGPHGGDSGEGVRRRRQEVAVVSCQFLNEPAPERKADSFEAHVGQHVYVKVDRGGGSADELPERSSLQPDEPLGEAEFECATMMILA